MRMIGDFFNAVIEYKKIFSLPVSEALIRVEFFCKVYGIDDLKGRNKRYHDFDYTAWRIFIYCTKNCVSLPYYGSKKWEYLQKIVKTLDK